MAFNFLDGLIHYPDTLPCPQVETDLVPRERRYLSDITDVRNMRMFQQEFQATRNKISFIFTEEEAREFRDWYENEILFGGAWFYADWPTLHRDKKVPHRFVGQPKYEWLFGANPGEMGRSAESLKPSIAVGAVTMYKVTATVELYERKVGSFGGVFTSKVYPIIVVDDVRQENGFVSARFPPLASFDDGVDLRSHVIISAQWMERLLEVSVSDDARTFNHEMVEGVWVEKLLKIYIEDAAQTYNHQIMSGEWTAKLITYPYYEGDAAAIQAHTIVSAEFVT